MPVTKKLGRPASEELRHQRTEEILDAAAKLFAERGYSATDTQTIADHLQVGKGTIYRYFPSKSELFLAAVDRMLRRLAEYVDASADEAADPMDSLLLATQAYLEFFENHPECVELLIQERAQFKDRKTPTYFEHQKANIGKWRDLFARLIAEGRVRDMPVERIINVCSDLVYGTMFTNYFTGRRRPAKEQAAEINDVVFEGILTERERKRRRACR